MNYEYWDSILIINSHGMSWSRIVEHFKMTTKATIQIARPYSWLSNKEHNADNCLGGVHGANRTTNRNLSQFMLETKCADETLPN